MRRQSMTCCESAQTLYGKKKRRYKFCRLPHISGQNGFNFIINGEIKNVDQMPWLGRQNVQSQWTNLDLAG